MEKNVRGSRGLNLHNYYWHTSKGITARIKSSEDQRKPRGSCLECGETLNKLHTKFCTQSCAAKHNNRKRKESGWQHSKKSKEKIRISSGITSRRLRTQLGKVKVKGKYIQDISIEKCCPYCKKLFKTSKFKPQKYCRSKECRRPHMLATRVLVRRSKAELRLQRLLSKVFDNVEGSNRSILDGLEVDIAIHSFKTIVEWDGVYHWKPIYGEEKLRAKQKRDQKKNKMLLERGWSVIRIKDECPKSATRTFIRAKFKATVKLIKEGFKGFITI